MTGKQMIIDDLVRRMENATVGTFDPIWQVFCRLIGENNPKNFERYIDRRKNRK